MRRCFSARRGCKEWILHHYWAAVPHFYLLYVPLVIRIRTVTSAVAIKSNPTDPPVRPLFFNMKQKSQAYTYKYRALDTCRSWRTHFLSVMSTGLFSVAWNHVRRQSFLLPVSVQIPNKLRWREKAWNKKHPHWLASCWLSLSHMGFWICSGTFSIAA